MVSLGRFVNEPNGRWRTIPFSVWVFFSLEVTSIFWLARVGLIGFGNQWSPLKFPLKPFIASVSTHDIKKKNSSIVIEAILFMWNKFRMNEDRHLFLSPSSCLRYWLEAIHPISFNEIERAVDWFNLWTGTCFDRLKVSPWTEFWFGRMRVGVDLTLKNDRDSE